MPRNTVPQEVLDLAARMVEDGASQMEISRTTGMDRTTILKRFPNAGWSLSEAGSFGRMIRTAKKDGVL